MDHDAMQGVPALARFDSFLPRWHRDRAAGRPLQACIWPFPGAAIFVDISGFSELTQRYQDKGEAGVEELSTIISTYLGQLIDRVHAASGDVEDLYGDALLAFWPAAPAGLHAAAAAALACAKDILARYDRQALPDGFRLRIRAAAVAGNLSALQVGGAPGQWHFILGGTCLLHIGPLLERARPGEVATSAVLRRVVRGAAVIEFPARHTPERLHPPCPVPCDDPELAPAFLPPWLRRRGAEHLGWLAEFRSLAVLCIGIDGMSGRGEAALRATQATVQLIQDVLSEFEGCIIRISMSEKGPMALAAFGLPDQAHDDDAVRAVHVAMRLRGALERSGLRARCSVTFGTTYCGIVGNTQRHVYTAMGEPVNRAAKLLATLDPGTIRCDEGIRQRALSRVEFEPAGAGLFRPVGARSFAPAPMRTLLGRDAELDRLQLYVDELDPQHPQPILSIEGEPGIGKSALIAALSGMVDGRFEIYHGAADSLAGKASPLAAWAGVLASMFAGQTQHDLAASLEREGVDPGVLTLVRPLFRLPPGARGEPSLLPQDAARITREVIAALLRGRFRGRLCLVVLDDVHWMDFASWELAAHIAREVPAVKLLLSGRPGAHDTWPALPGLARRVPLVPMRLGPLDPAATARVVTGTLGPAKLPHATVEKIQERSGGNPLFAILLALSFRGPASPARLPESIQRTIVAGIDRLAGDLQIALKAASVIGIEFSGRALEVALRPTQDHHGQSTRLAQLAESGVIRVVRPGPDDAYRFDHALVQEAVYALLPFEQRARLHGHVAAFFDGEQPERQPGPAVIGLHWSRANRPDRALPCWEAAGVSALAGGAYREAAAALQEAVTAAEAAHPGTERGRKGRLNRLFGEVLLHCGQVELSQHHFLGALDHLGFASSGSRLGTPVLLLRSLAEHLVRWPLSRRRPAKLDPAEAERLREASLAFEGLGQVFGHRTKLTGMLAATVAALNLALRIADPAVSSRSAGLLAVALQMANVPSVARRYLAQAQGSFHKIGHAHDRLLSMEYVALFLIGGGRLPEANAALRTMLDLAKHANNRRRQLDATSLLILTAMAQGAFADCTEWLEWFRVAAEHEDDQQVRCWMHLEHASFALAQGRPDQAMGDLQAAGESLPETGGTERVWTSGLLAFCLMQQSRPTEALEAARQTLAELAGWRSLAFYAQDGVFGAAEVFLRTLEQAETPPPGLSLEIRTMMRRVAGFGLRLPISRPRTLVLLGRYAALLGHRRTADRLLRRARHEASAAGRPAELAHANEQLRRLTPR